MSLSSFSYHCISNNPHLRGRVAHLELIDGNALDVLTASRDRIHCGWRLASSPFYGNFKPDQQPYRTIVLYEDRAADIASVDLESLRLIEDAMASYGNSRALRLPDDFPKRIDMDFRFVDFALMEDTFRECGILDSPAERVLGR